MISRLVLVLIICLPSSAFAMEEIAPNESTNFCLNKQSALKNEALAKKYPEDERIIMLVALRPGLCDLLEKKIIELDFAIDLFNQSQTTNILERFQEDVEDNKNKGIFDI